jgi:L-ascorbate metabolism protein UlaG (beta-lactamase superfamily)
VYAADVRLHSAGGRRRHDWVRSTFQRSFRSGYVFETKNTTYLLMGDGHRKKASVGAVLSIVE